jgi:uncharacterized membrane protein YuzA (DUF378 family)
MDGFFRSLLKLQNGVGSLDRFALVLVIIGALNWLLVGLFRYDLVANIFGGHTAPLSRIIYSLIGIAGLYCIKFLFREREEDSNPNKLPPQ